VHPSSGALEKFIDAPAQFGLKTVAFPKAQFPAGRWRHAIRSLTVRGFVCSILCHSDSFLMANDQTIDPRQRWGEIRAASN
jgi:hypothetical protein